MISGAIKTSLVLITMATALAAGGCMTPAAETDATGRDIAHNARNSLDWAGVYRGVLPCADCEGIETVVALAGDGTYSTQTKYLGKGEQVFSETGRFTWNDAGTTVTLAGDQPARYFVAENRLVRLTLDGSRITGPLAEHYILVKRANR